MLTEREELILDILCERRYAYLGEVVREAEIASEEAERTLRALADLGYVRRYQGRHGLRYRITAEGREAARTPNPEVWTA
ncbi:hypothetical protein [Symbiobacterium thermophilum]|uniref:Uncharacterized protein n=1 Tax=Symbiobacterium thermophilum TaxID=2734 RepID=A0A953LFQ6_SYMTR|nr:hypothetical protein [Symbiobacterium thermophilum]MBY6277850.1 hypothetical protein [Symbiobacterium thermophilum]